MNIRSFLIISCLFFLSGCTTKPFDVEQNVIDGTGRFLHDVIVVAHVGAPYEATYNSLAGFALAKKYGADAVEFDVSLTKDNQTIVMHGPSMEMNSTCQHPMKNVADYTLAEIKEDCKLNNGEPIRSLEEMLSEIKGRFAYYFIEMKVYDEHKISLQADDIAAVIKKLGLGVKAIVTSYDHDALAKIVEQGIMGGRDTYTLSEFYHVDSFAYPYFLVDFRELQKEPVLIDRLRGKFVAYTASDVKQFKQIYDMGVRIIMTDDIKNTMHYVLSGDTY